MATRVHIPGEGITAIGINGHEYAVNQDGIAVIDDEDAASVAHEDTWTLLGPVIEAEEAQTEAEKPARRATRRA